MDAKISIIVPVYNVEKYIYKCVNSILEQTYSNLEIILVDDGSLDNCPKICDDFAQKDSRITVIHKQNGGLSSARNAGLDEASGDYIAFVDSDDYILPHMYESLYNLIKTHSADIAICDLDWIQEDGSAYNEAGASPIKDEVFTKQEAYKKLCEGNYFFYVTAVNKLYKKTIFEKVRFPVGKVHEDEFTAHHIYSKCNRIVSCKNSFYKYVQHQGTIMHSPFTIRKLDAAEAFYDRYLFFRKNKERECAKFALIQSYGILIQCIQRLNINIYKKEINPLIKKVMFSLFIMCNPRCFKLILVFCKKKIREVGVYLRFVKRGVLTIKKARKKFKRIAVIIATPEHGNLGDQAIVKAEKLFLSSNGFDKNAIVEICNSDYLRFGDKLVSHIKENDLVIIDGGGNLGSLWEKEDDKISKIIAEYPNNKVIVFPQTVYYDDSKESQNRIKNNYQIYKLNKKLIVCLREKNSYEFFIKNFPDIKSILVPDVVLSIKDINYDIIRKDALVCFRDDVEKNIDDVTKEYIITLLAKKGYKVKTTSTLVDYPVTVANRDIELSKKWAEFASSEIVITDRLHAMIFATITNTPCIAIDNKSKKVSGSYEWIKDNKYVKCVESLDEIEYAIDEVTNNKGTYIGMKNKFDLLIQGLRDE